MRKIHSKVRSACVGIVFNFHRITVSLVTSCFEVSLDAIIALLGIHIMHEKPHSFVSIFIVIRPISS